MYIPIVKEHFFGAYYLGTINLRIPAEPVTQQASINKWMVSPTCKAGRTFTSKNKDNSKKMIQITVSGQNRHH